MFKWQNKYLVMSLLKIRLLSISVCFFFVFSEVRRMISKNNFCSIFFAFLVIPVLHRNLFNVIECLFQIRHNFSLECHVDTDEHVRYLYIFSQNHNAAKYARDICAVHGDNFITERIPQKMVFPI